MNSLFINDQLITEPRIFSNETIYGSFIKFKTVLINLLCNLNNVLCKNWAKRYIMLRFKGIQSLIAILYLMNLLIN